MQDKIIDQIKQIFQTASISRQEFNSIVEQLRSILKDFQETPDNKLADFAYAFSNVDNDTDSNEPLFIAFVIKILELATITIESAIASKMDTRKLNYKRLAYLYDSQGDYEPTGELAAKLYLKSIRNWVACGIEELTQDDFERMFEDFEDYAKYSSPDDLHLAVTYCEQIAAMCQIKIQYPDRESSIGYALCRVNILSKQAALFTTLAQQAKPYLAAAKTCHDQLGQDYDGIYYKLLKSLNLQVEMAKFSNPIQALTLGKDCLTIFLHLSEAIEEPDMSLIFESIKNILFTYTNTFRITEADTHKGVAFYRKLLMMMLDPTYVINFENLIIAVWNLCLAEYEVKGSYTLYIKEAKNIMTALARLLPNKDPFCQCIQNAEIMLKWQNCISVLQAALPEQTLLGLMEYDPNVTIALHKKINEQNERIAQLDEQVTELKKQIALISNLPSAENNLINSIVRFDFNQDDDSDLTTDCNELKY